MTEGLYCYDLKLARFIKNCLYNPSVTRSARHLPLHKEGLYLFPKFCGLRKPVGLQANLKFKIFLNFNNTKIIISKVLSESARSNASAFSSKTAVFTMGIARKIRLIFIAVCVSLSGCKQT